MMHEAVNRQNGYIHRALLEAEQRGGEPSVLRLIEQRVISEYLMRCMKDGLNVRELAAEDIASGVHGMLKGMVNPDREQRAIHGFNGFKEMYRATQDDLRTSGKRLAEQHVQSIVDALSATQNPKMPATERSAMEGRIVRETVVAASAYRVAGMNPMQVIQLIRSNTDVGHLPIVSLMEQSVVDEFNAAVVRRQENAGTPSRGSSLHPMRSPSPSVP